MARSRPPQKYGATEDVDQLGDGGKTLVGSAVGGGEHSSLDVLGPES